jgi:hypothetical protein
MDLKVFDYCSGAWKPSKLEETDFLSSSSLQLLTNLNKSANTGHLSEWSVKQILDTIGLDYDSQLKIKLPHPPNIIPDFYLPGLDLFIEVKSRGYNCPGTASEKLDYIIRKYSRVQELPLYKNSKLLVVCCAQEMFESSTLELLNPIRNPVKKLMSAWRQIGFLDIISFGDLEKYIKNLL